VALLHKDARLELLQRVPLFAGLSRDELAEVASVTDELNLPDARELTREGESGKEFVVLVEGEADVIRDGALVAGLGPGDFLGEIALVTGEPRTATVRTRGPARVLVMSAQAFRTLLHDVPSIQTSVLMAVATRIPREFE
jgi:CRP-like cAMP-binding protein